MTGAVSDHDIIIIGAGVCGLYQLYRLRELGLPMPAAMVLASPLVDMTFSSPSTARFQTADPFSQILSGAMSVLEHGASETPN